MIKINKIWKPIKGYEGIYEVSNFGEIKALEKRVDSGKCHRLFKSHILKTARDKKGYCRCVLSDKGEHKTYKVHRLVAEAFIPNPNGYPQVNHKDGNKANNRADNLEWCNQSHNIKHAFENGLMRACGENNSAVKLTADDVKYIREHYTPRHKEFSTVALAQKFKVHRKTISRIVCGKCWKGGGADVKNKSLQASS